MLAENLFLTHTLYTSIVLNQPFYLRECVLFIKESGTLSVTNPIWLVKNCLCLQYLITELKDMYSDFHFYRCTFHVHGKSSSGSLQVFLKAKFEN